MKYRIKLDKDALRERLGIKDPEAIDLDSLREEIKTEVTAETLGLIPKSLTQGEGISVEDSVISLDIGGLEEVENAQEGDYIAIYGDGGHKKLLLEGLIQKKDGKTVFVGGPQSALAIDDEGVLLTTGATEIDFVGSGVTATAVGTKVTVTIPGTDTFAAIQVDGVTQNDAVPTLDFDGTDFILTESPADDFDITINPERIQDIVGAMLTGNTETGIAVTYEDGDGTIDFVVSDLTVAGDTGSTGMTPGDTLTVAGGTGISTAMSGDTLTITNDSPNVDQNLFETVTITDTDSGFTWAETGSVVADTTTDTLTFVSGVGIDFDVDAASDAIRVHTVDSGIDHDALSNFVANEHIDHTAVTLTAGEGLSGGGDISASRSFALDLNELTTLTAIASGDKIPFTDIDDSNANKNITFANFESTLNLANLSGTLDISSQSNLAVADTATVDMVLTGDTLSANVIAGGIDHGGLAGLSDDDHTQYLLLAGRSGGQTAIGGTGAGDDLTLQSNSVDDAGEISLRDSTGAMARFYNRGWLELVQGGGTFTAAFIPIIIDSAITWSAAASAVEGYKFNPTITTTADIGAGTLFDDNAVVINDSATAADPTNWISFQSQPEFTADSQALTQTQYVGHNTDAEWKTSGGGTFAVTAITSFLSGANKLGSGVTVTDYYGARLLAPDVTGGGTVTNLYGLKVENIGAGTSNWAIHTTGGKVHINAGGTDSDTQIEGDTDTNLFRADASTDSVGIGIAAPLDKLHVAKSTVARVFVEETSTGVETKLVADDPLGGVGTTSAHKFQIFSNNSTAVNIDTSQNVTVGAETVKTVFNVNGDISVLNKGEVRFYETGSTNYVGFEAGTLAGDQIWVLPTADGSADQFLKTDGAGNLSWDDAGGSSEWTDTGTLLHPADLSGAEDVVVGGTTLGGADVILGKEGYIIVNEQGADQDSRFEGTGDANLLYTDAGNDRVGVGTATPDSKLHVSGTFHVTGNEQHEADTIVYKAGADCIESSATSTTVDFGFANTGALTVTTTGAGGGTYDYYVEVPQQLHGTTVTVREVIFYFTDVSATDFITRNELREYNPTDGTNTAHDNDLANITSGTSHTMGGTPFTMGSSESGSAVMVRLRLTFSAANTIVLWGVKVTFDSA